MGTAALGGMFESVTEEDAFGLIDAAFDNGISFFDTAPQYGHGVAERRLGRGLAGRDRGSYQLSTKVGRLVVESPGADTGIFEDADPSEMVFAFDRDSVLRSLDESMGRLGTDRVDVVLIHDPDDHPRQAINETYRALAELRDEGVVRAIGVGMNQSALPTRFVEETDIDVVLLAGRYTLLDQTGARDLIPAARERGVSIMIGGVFNSGVLVDTARPPMFNYKPAPPEIVARAKALEQVCLRHGVSLPQAALAFPLREPAVATVLLGARNPTELTRSLEMAAAEVPEELWRELAEEELVHEYDAGEG